MVFEMSHLGRREMAMEYISAACLANVPSWVLLLFLTFFDINKALLSALGFLAVFSGAMLGGFLATRRRARDGIKAGISVGLLSYVIHVVSLTLLFGNFLLLLTSEGGDLLIMADFALGGIFGGMVNRRRLSKRA